nr:non-ribosomal peptide synthetase [Aliikangiella marina]
MCKEQGVKITVHGEKLRVKSNSSSLSSELEAALRSNKKELIEFLTSKKKTLTIRRLNETEKLSIPLSFTQQRLWFHSQFAGPNSVYNIPLIYRLSKTVDSNVLVMTLQKLVERHEILRTRIVVKDNTAYQSIQSKLPTIRVEECDTGQLLDVIRVERNYLFDLEHDDLCRIKLLRLIENDDEPESSSLILILNCHHAIFDGWSSDVLIKELNQLYSAATKGGVDKLKLPEYQFSDYAYWQRKHLKGETLEKYLNYWKKQLADLPSLLTLPTDFPRPEEQSFKGSTQSIKFSKKIKNELEAFCKTQGVTLYMTLLSTFFILLSRYSGQEDIAVGTPVANRTLPEVENLIGFFANTLVVRGNLNQNLSFHEFLQQVKDTTLNAYNFQDFPFERIVEEIQPERSTSYSPLFQVMFVLQANASSTTGRAPLELEPFEFETGNQDGVSRFDLTLSIQETEDGMVGGIEYSTDLFTAKSINLMLTHYQNLLDIVVRSPHLKISEYNFLTPLETEQQLIDWNDTTHKFPKGESIVDLFNEQVLKTPDSIALINKNEMLSYKELNNAARNLACILVEQGVGVEDRVGICLERSLDMVISILAITKAGACYVPVDPEYPQSRINYIVNDSAIELVITNNTFKSKIGESKLQILLWEEISKLKLYSEEEGMLSTHSHYLKTLKPTHPENLVYMIYTSGSTGRPKGVGNINSALVNRIDWMQKQYQLVSGDKILQKTPYSFDVSVWEFFWPLVTGASLVIAQPGGHKDPAYLIEEIRKQYISMLHFVPSMLKAFLSDHNWTKCLSLRQVVCSGEALPKEVSDNFLNSQSFINLDNLYGPTEAAIDVSFWRCKIDKESTTNPIGRPIQNTQLYIVDKHNQLLPRGACGELVIAGEGLSRGYYGKAALTADKFIPNPYSKVEGARLYKTGDLVRYLCDGRIEYLGRLDDQIKIRGFRIELGEIEQLLMERKEVTGVVVLAREDIPDRKYLAAYLELSNGFKLQNQKSEAESNYPEIISDLKSYLSEKLPSYMIPSYFTIIDSIPLSANGKVAKRLLPKPDEAAETAKYLAPSNEVEIKLCDIWKNVLAKEKIGIKDNFFAIGGDSISSIQVVSKAKSAGITISVKDIFKRPTIKSLSEIVGLDNQEVTRDSAIGSLPLLPVQKWFFKAQLTEPSHFFQSQLLSVPNGLNRKFLVEFLSQLIKRHDVLRLKFDFNNEYRAEFIDASQIAVGSCVEEIKIDDFSDIELKNQIKSYGSYFKTNFKLIGDSPFKLVFFKSNSNENSALLLIFHHLIVDGVSWRVLYEDLLLAFSQFSAGSDIVLPEKTSSYLLWSKMLTTEKFVQSVLREKRFWYGVLKNLALPRLNLKEFDKYSDSSHMSLQFNSEETKALLGDSNYAYNTKIQDLILASVYASVVKLIGCPSFRVDVEGHGREDDLFRGCDLSETVGWFTSVYPLKLDAESVTLSLNNDYKSRQIAKAIICAKEARQHTPNQGLGFGVLRYLLNDPMVTELDNNNPALLLFNYFGQFNQQKNNQGLFESLPYDTGSDVGGSIRRKYPIGLNAWIKDELLTCNIDISTNKFSTKDINEFINDFRENIRFIISHCKTNSSVTPSDFELVKPEYLKLDSWINAYPEFQDVYPTTDMQKGLIYLSLLDNKKHSYTTQLVFELKGTLHTKHLKNAWSKLVQSNEIFRTAFANYQSEDWVQIVLSRCDLKWYELDWQRFSSEEQREKKESLLQTDKTKPYDLNAGSLMRLYLIKMSQDETCLIWSHHHCLLDGWSISSVLGDLFRIYFSLEKHREFELTERVPYKAFIKWLTDQDYKSARDFWCRELDGVKIHEECQNSLLEMESSSVSSKEVVLNLNSHQSAAVKRVVKDLNVTINTYFQAAWSYVNYLFSNENDVVFGQTVSGRNVPVDGIENMIGLFINTIPVRVKIDKSQKISEWLKEISARQQESLEFSFLSLVEISKALGLRENQSLFNSLLVFENYPINSSLGDALGVDGSSLRVTNCYSKEGTEFPLTLVIYVSKTIDFKFNFKSAIYSDSMICRLVEVFKQIVVSMSKSHEQSIGDLNCFANGKSTNNMRDSNLDNKSIKTIAKEISTRIAYGTDTTIFETWLEKILSDKSEPKWNGVTDALNESFVLVALIVKDENEQSRIASMLMERQICFLRIDPAWPALKIRAALQLSNANIIITERNIAKSVYINDGDLLKVYNVDSSSALCLFTIDHYQKHESNFDVRNSAVVELLSNDSGQFEMVGVTHAYLEWMLKHTFSTQIGESLASNYPKELEWLATKLRLSSNLKEHKVSPLKVVINQDKQIVDNMCHGFTAILNRGFFLRLNNDGNKAVDSRLISLSVDGQEVLVLNKNKSNYPQKKIDTKKIYSDFSCIAPVVSDVLNEQVDQAVNLKHIYLQRDCNSPISFVQCFVETKVASDSCNSLQSNIRERLKRCQSLTPLPTRILFSETLPTKNNGEINFVKLIGLDKKERGKGAKRMSPTEEIVAGVWSDTLGIKNISPQDDFFQIGGNSISATQLLNRINHIFSLNLTLKEVFVQKTLKKLALFVDHKKGSCSHRVNPIEKAERDKALTTSFAQQRMWLANEYIGANNIYNIFVAFVMTGKVNENVLLDSLQDIIERHEVLRSRFKNLDGELVQLISESNFDLIIEDESDLNRVKSLFEAEREFKFNLYEDDLCRVKIVKCKEDGKANYIISVTMHHIISDGWSIGVLIEEFKSNYSEKLKDSLYKAPTLPIQYVDYSEWQRDMLLNGSMKNQLGYWKRQLSDLPLNSNLPTDFSRPSKPSYKGSSVEFSLGRSVTSKVKSFCHGHGVTLYMFFITVFSILLSRYTNKKDIVIGSPVANRTHSQLEALIGFFVNMLVMRFKLENNHSFLETVKSAREITLDAYANQELPFEVLVDSLLSDREGNISPLFQVMFAFQNSPIDNNGLSGVQLLSLTESGLFDFKEYNQVSRYDLSFSLRESNGLIVGDMEFTTDLFKETTIKRLLSNFTQLITAFVNDPQGNIYASNLVIGQQREQLTEIYRSKDISAYMRSPSKLLKNIVANHSSSVTYNIEEKTLTSQDIDWMSDQIVGEALSRELSTNPKIGILCRGQVNRILTSIAVLKLGGCCVILDSEAPDLYIANNAQELKLELIITDQQSRSSIVERLVLPNFKKCSARIKFDHNNPAQNSAALCLSWHNNESRLKYCTLNYAQLSTLAKSIDSIDDYLILKNISSEDLRLIRDLLNVLAETDNGSSSSNSESTSLYIDEMINTDEANRLYLSENLLVLDDQLEPTDVDQCGDIFIAEQESSEQVGVSAVEQASYFLPNPFSCQQGRRIINTKIKAKVNADKSIVILDEEENISNLAGCFAYEEECLNSLDFVCDSLMAEIDDSRLSKKLTCFIESSDKSIGREMVSSDVFKKVSQHVKKAERLNRLPHSCFRLGNLPLNSYGLYDLDKLKREVRSDEVKPDVPRTITENALFKVWSEVLGISNFNFQESFFRLGGNSLLATKVIARLNEKYSITVKLKDLFQNSRFDELVKFVEASIKDEKCRSNTEVVPVGRGRRLELSFSQQRLWFINEVTGPSSIYNMPIALKLTGDIDVNLLLRVLNHLVYRHESLRTRFVSDHDTPYQLIDKYFPLKIETINFSKSLKSICKSEQLHRFDLSSDPLARIRLLEDINSNQGDTPSNVAVLLTLHHSVADGWSLGVLFREINLLYRELASGLYTSLSMLSAQYADYAHWQRGLVDTEEFKAQLSYWHKRLEGLPQRHGLIFDNPRPSKESYAGKVFRHVMSKSNSTRLQAFCVQQGITLFMFLHTCLSVMISRYSGESDVVIGTPIANRENTELENVVGLFLNNLVLRMKIDPSQTFISALQENKQNIIEAFDNQQVPFDLLVERINPEREGNENPLFQIMLVLQNATETQLDLPQVKIDSLIDSIKTTKFDLELSVKESMDGVVYDWIFKTDLFKAETIERLARNFNELIVNVLDNPDREIAQISALTNAETNQLLESSRLDAENKNKNSFIYEPFEMQAKLNPHAIAAYFNGISVSYCSLNQSSNQVARMLVSNAVSVGSLVGVCVRRSIDLLAVILGILKCGATCVSINIDTPKERIKMLVNDLDILVTEQGFMFGANCSKPYIEIDNENTKKELASLLSTNLQTEERNEPRLFNENSIAYITYTSGSTGNPKGVMTSHSNILNYLSYMNEVCDISTTSSCLQLTAQGFDAAFREIFGTLVNGGKLVLLDDSDAKDAFYVKQTLARQKITHLLSIVPSFLRVVNQVELPEVYTSFSLKLIMSTGEVLRYSDCRLARNSFGDRVRIINNFGPTECTMTSAYYEVDNIDDEGLLVPCGRPIRNVSFYILDDYLKLLPKGGVGELYIGGEGVTLGYYNKTELTRNSFIQNPYVTEPDILYKTGDLVRLNCKGDIEFIGRKDEQVKILGARVELAEIASLLCLQEAIKDAVVLLDERNNRRVEICAYVISEGDSASVEQEKTIVRFLDESLELAIQSELRKYLPESTVPSIIYQVNQFPLLQNGKINKKKLLELTALLARKPAVELKTEVEKRLASLWCEVLELGEVTRLDNFFKLGGHSLLLTQLRVRIRHEFDLDISLQKMFENQTLALQASILEAEINGNTIKNTIKTQIKQNKSKINEYADDVEEGEI